MNYSLRPETAAAFAGKTVLLTGSAGFLGRHFTKALDEAGARVTGIDLVDGYDATDPGFWKRSDTADMVIHAAGIASPFHYRAKPLRALDACVSGVRNALDYCAQRKARLLYLSSSEIYGNPDKANVPTQESYRGNVS